MTRTTRLLLGVAAVAVLLAIRLPLWEVRLGAPQYPEGLGLRILSHTVEGLKPNDLNSINVLNHYIGMKAIEPDAIPELRYMPWILAGLAGSLGLIALRGGRRMMMAWLVATAVLGAVGLWDFWRWEYAYGHELDLETAAIIVPGMSYQPPLIGSKQLLNFTAMAWPGTGAIALGVAWLLVAVLWWRTRARQATVSLGQGSALSLLVVLTMGGCAPHAPEIALDLDECRFCRMIIADDRFAAAATTSGGRTVRFDSIECLAGWVLAEEEPPRAVWVSDREHPGALIPAAEARFVRDTTLATPMRGGWQGFAIDHAPAGAIVWDSVVALVRLEPAR